MNLLDIFTSKKHKTKKAEFAIKTVLTKMKQKKKIEKEKIKYKDLYFEKKDRVNLTFGLINHPKLVNIFLNFTDRTKQL